MIGKDKSHFFDLEWLIFVLRTTFMFPPVFRHDHRMILFVSSLSGLAQYCCSLKLFLFNRGTALSSSKWPEALSSAPPQLAGPAEGVPFQGCFLLPQSPFWPKPVKAGLQDIHLEYSGHHHCWAFGYHELKQTTQCGLWWDEGFSLLLSLWQDEPLNIWWNNCCAVTFITLDMMHHPRATQVITRNRNKNGY